MTTTVKTPVREPATATAYSSTALYICPSDGSVKHATITHVYARNYTTANASLTIASVSGSGTPGASEATTNEYYKFRGLTADNGQVLSDLIGKKLLPGEYVNELASAASSIIVELSVLEELNS